VVGSAETGRPRDANRARDVVGDDFDALASSGLRGAAPDLGVAAAHRGDDPLGRLAIANEAAFSWLLAVAVAEVTSSLAATGADEELACRQSPQPMTVALALRATPTSAPGSALPAFGIDDDDDDDGVLEVGRAGPLVWSGGGVLGPAGGRRAPREPTVQTGAGNAELDLGLRVRPASDLTILPVISPRQPSNDPHGGAGLRRARRRNGTVHRRRDGARARPLCPAHTVARAAPVRARSDAGGAARGLSARLRFGHAPVDPGRRATMHVWAQAVDVPPAGLCTSNGWQRALGERWRAAGADRISRAAPRGRTAPGAARVWRAAARRPAVRRRRCVRCAAARRSRRWRPTARA
jgi:hypothetical protein